MEEILFSRGREQTPGDERERGEGRGYGAPNESIMAACPLQLAQAHLSH